MNDEEIKAIFDQQAAGYDKRWEKMAPIRDLLHFLVDSIFAELPIDARILCVGLGTGQELSHLARKFPGWRFTAVEPSSVMLDLCSKRAEQEGYASRCYFHEGYLDSLPIDEAYDAATCFLVSQFILDKPARSAFFRGIARRLRPGGILASSDLASDVRSDAYKSLLEVWFRTMSGAGVTPEALENMRAGYAKDVAILPTPEVASIIAAGGFEMPVLFFQAGLIHGWYSRRLVANA
jgi:tRNA (cmo5U34)-methyltransferase